MGIPMICEPCDVRWSGKQHRCWNCGTLGEEWQIWYARTSQARRAKEELTASVEV